jgi:hypothetical protein
MTKVEAIKKILEDNNGIATWKIIFNEIVLTLFPQKKTLELLVQYFSGKTEIIYRNLVNSLIQKIK